jgi:NAD(P)-dependent dehydrogenase (short-subunit alcohol dehydrogenase family)
MNGDGHSLIVTDVTIDEDINNMVSMVPVLDGVVLDSGVGFTLPITFCSKEKFRQVFEVNFFGHSEIVRLLYKKKKIVNDGSIVFISSIGSELHAPANSIYDAAKSAMNSFMESCALEFSSRKVRVNAVLPGMTHTKLTAPTGALTEEDLKKDEEKYPLRRYAEPLDIARPVVFLLSDAASWITGTRLKVDGGISLT